MATALVALFSDGMAGFDEQLAHEELARPSEAAFLMKVDLVNLKRDCFFQCWGGCSNFGVSAL